MSLRRALLLALLASGLAFAPIEPIDLTFAVPLVIIIVIILLALTGMLAQSISDPRLEAWYKTELREFVAGVILVVVISGAFISSSGVSVAITGQSNYIDVSTAILDDWLRVFDQAFYDLIGAAGHIRSAATYAPYINVPLWYVSLSYSTNPLAGIAMMLGSLNIGAQALTNAVFLTEGLRLLVVFLKVVTPPILLPLSFILRIIPFSRRLGNTLISISLGGIVFLPFAIILVDALNDTILVPEPVLEDLGALDTFLPANVVEPLCETVPLRVILGLTDPLFALLVCSPLLLAVITAPAFPGCFQLVQNVIYPLINVIFQIAMTALLVGWEAFFIGAAGGAAGYADSVFDQVHPFLTEINNYVLVTYIDFILIATITVAGARSLSSALGGEWYMAGIQRLI